MPFINYVILIVGISVFQKFLPENSFIQVPQLETSDITSILESWLEAFSRTLQPKQMDFLRQACEKCRLPLYTKIAFDETKRWSSYTDVLSEYFGDSVQALISTLLDRVEKYHGPLLVSQALAMITAAKSGLRYVNKFST